jgi:hypothetical protein
MLALMPGPSAMLSSEFVWAMSPAAAARPGAGSAIAAAEDALRWGPWFRGCRVQHFSPVGTFNPRSRPRKILQPPASSLGV